MNKGSNNHYTLLLQDEAETDGVGLEEEEEEVEAGLNVMEEEEEEEDEEEDDDDDEPMEDSDEEEIFSSSKHRTLSHHEGANLNGQNHIGGHGNEYRLLNNNDADLKTVLDTPITIWTPTPMSPARRACFIASIMFGILVVATFLWVLPCDVQPCEGELGLTDRNWAVKIEGMGINQTILVRRLAGGNNVLLSYYTSINISSWDPDNSSLSADESWQSDHTQTDCSNCGVGENGDSSGSGASDGHCGLLMLDGNLGRENWRFPLRECPVDLQCDVLDVSGDGIPDCIVRGTHSMVFMIEARYGTPVWHLHVHKEIDDSSSLAPHPTAQTSHSPLRLYHPGPAVLLPDINNDSYGELLFSGLLSYEDTHSWNREYQDSENWNVESDLPESSSSNAYINHLVLVCGQSGSVMGSPLPLEHCKTILSVSSDGSAINYSCLGSKGDTKVGTIHLTVLLHQILGDAAPTQESQSSQENLKSQKQYHPVRKIKRDPCYLIVYNNGVCPQCQSKIQLRHSDGHVMWHKSYEHSAVVSWAALLSDGECHGAIMKVWEWKRATTFVKTVKPPPSINRRTTRSSFISDGTESVETEPTYPEKDAEDKIELDNAINSNISSESNQISDIPHDNFFKKYSKDGHASLNEEIINPVREDYSDVQPPTTLESPRARRNFLHDPQKLQYEHPTIHRHRGKQASGSHEDHNKLSENSATAQEPKINSDTHDFRESYHHPQEMASSTTLPSPIPTEMRTMPPSVLAPHGYQLQQIHERLALLKSNGTVWHEETLANLGLGITQLCKNENTCIPDIESHGRSVAVTHGVEERAWQLTSSSTTYVSTPINGEQHHTSPWTLTSIVRKIIVYV